MLRLQNVIGRSEAFWLDQQRVISETDELTGLYNRSAFMQKAKQQITENRKTTYALVRMDIDHFHLYNSSYGAAAGDRLLLAIAKGIKRETPPQHIYGRIDSDIFCLCVPYQAQTLEKRCEDALEKGRKLSRDFFIKFSFGIYIITNPDLDMEKMYSYATDAAHKCKHNLNTAYALYDESMEKAEKYAAKITNEIDSALKNHEFEVYLQPKYSFATQRACGAEALIRWNHPQNGMMSPGSFIPIAEKNGMILQIDRYMWENVCILLRRWLDTGKTPQPISVNVSRVSLYHPHLVEYLVSLIDRYHVPSDLLNLEITESAYMSDPEMMRKTIEQLHENGFVIMMDDFGSGYSSLNTLKDIEVDVLKIDMKFLPAGSNDVKSEKILTSVLHMAGWLGLSVIVEGVETKAQKDFLESIGCDYVQGYYFAKPMPVSAYEDMPGVFCKEPDVESEVKFSEDIDSIWSSSSNIGTLFKSVAVPFVILEFANRRVEILRKNISFSATFGAEIQLTQLLAPDQLATLQLALEKVASLRENAECDCLFIMPNSIGKWYRLRLNYIEASKAACLIGATFSDITTERMLEQEINRFSMLLKKTSAHKSRMLIVDDSELSQKLLCEMFQDQFQILMASNEQEGLVQLEQHADSIAIILLDMIMPVLDGMGFLARKNMLPAAADIPVVVISNDGGENSQLNMLEHGISDYVTKPFVPKLVQRRVHNVLEYRSRFQNLLLEYQKASLLDIGRTGRISMTGYTVDDLRRMLALLGEVFDMARIVDPAQTAVITFGPEGEIVKKPYTCFKVWKKESRCENCSSFCAQRGRCVMTKFELIANDVFYVVSRPIEVILTDRSEPYVLEVVSYLSGQAALCEQDKKSIHDMIEQTHRQIYSDPLTGIYNRRYLDEMLFLQRHQNAMARRIGVIVMDITGFEKINDRYGHPFGDEVLKRVAQMLQKQVRSTDSVIRMDADEFVIIQTSSEQEFLSETIKRLDAALGEISFSQNRNLQIHADFGAAYAQDFGATMAELSALLVQADHNMHQHKKSLKK